MGHWKRVDNFSSKCGLVGAEIGALKRLRGVVCRTVGEGPALLQKSTKSYPLPMPEFQRSENLDGIFPKRLNTGILITPFIACLRNRFSPGHFPGMRNMNQ